MDGAFPSHWYALLAVGLLAGLLSGTLGVGSGALLVPALVLLFSFAQKSAQGTALAVMVPMVLIGAVQYKLIPEVHVGLWPVLLLSLGAVVGVLAGAELASRLPDYALRRIFAIFLIAVAMRMLFSRPRPAPAAPRASAAAVDIDSGLRRSPQEPHNAAGPASRATSIGDPNHGTAN